MAIKISKTAAETTTATETAAAETANNSPVVNTQLALKGADDDFDERVIVRVDRAGVFFGKLVSRNGQEGIIENARRIFYWDGAASLSELAVRGSSKPGSCKFPAPVNQIMVFQIIEILRVTRKAAQNIDKIAVWSA
jgi:hypothetical protein